MPEVYSYSSGTLTLESGSTTVGITGGLAIPLNMRPGDQILIGGSTLNAISSLGSDPAFFEIVQPWDGADAAGVSFIVFHMPMGWGEQVDLHEDIAEYLRLLGEGIIASANYATKAELDADLMHTNGSLGKVYNDPSNRANEGLYKKIGPRGSGSWQYLGLLPERRDLVQYLISQTAAIAANAAAIIEIRNEML